jgi:hypothetical protein
MRSSITVGSPAPEFVYRTRSGEEKRLSEWWSSTPAVILWLRHCG